MAGLIGVAGFHARKSPAGLRARPIGHWQHWNWQHFHIGNISIVPRPPSPGKGVCFAQTFHSPCPSLARLCGALGHVRSIRSPLVRAQDAHGETASHTPKTRPMTAPSTARPRGGRAVHIRCGGLHSGWRASMPANPQRASAPALIRGGGLPRPQIPGGPPRPPHLPLATLELATFSQWQHSSPQNLFLKTLLHTTRRCARSRECNSFCLGLKLLLFYNYL